MSGRVGRVASLDEAARMALELPEVAEGERYGSRTWSVAGKAFAWERPFSKADIRRFGDASPPGGPIPDLPAWCESRLWPSAPVQWPLTV